jgi:hypothetical protein
MNRASSTDTEPVTDESASAHDDRGVERLATILALDAQRPIDQAGMLNHLSATAELVEHYGGSEAQIRAGWLHEARSVESPSQALLDDIERRFGGDVVEIIESFSTAPCYPELPQRVDHGDHFRRLESIEAGSPALLVLGADALHQARQVYGALRASGGGRDTRAGRVAADSTDFFLSVYCVLHACEIEPLATDLRYVGAQIQELLDGPNDFEESNACD